MIDLETLGTNPDCPVISIGATFFDIEKKVLGPTFYLPLDIQSQLDAGRKVDADTIKWWLGQSNAAKHVFKEKAQDPKKVLELLSQFVKQHPKSYVWGNGSTFDITILESLYATYGLDYPWSHFNIMDLRTFKRFIARGKKVMNHGVSHNALDDAISQAQYVMNNMK